MEEASAIDCCAMGQAGNFGVIHLSLLEKAGKRMDCKLVTHPNLIYSHDRNLDDFFLLLLGRFATVYMDQRREKRLVPEEK